MTMFDGARVFIGGQFRAAERSVPVVEGAIELPLGDGASATEAEVDAAVRAAR